MPPLDYDQFATKTDLENLEIRLSSRIDGLESSMRVGMSELETRVANSLTTQMRPTVGMNLAMFLGLGTWITAVT